MTLVELKYVCALAAEGRVGRAAKRCHVSQPTLSIALNKLEQDLGVTLFERNKNTLCITPLGKQFVEQARHVLAEEEKLYAVTQASGNQLDTPLRVGGIYTVGSHIFPRLVKPLKRCAPDMPLIIEENFTHVLREKLQRAELDAIFISLPFSDKGVVCKKLYEEDFVVLLPKQHRLAAKAAIGQRDLARENVLLLGKGHCFREQVLAVSPQRTDANLEQQMVEGGSLDTLRYMVASGEAVSIFPKNVAGIQQNMLDTCVRPFSGKIPKRWVALAWRVSFPRTQAIDALVKACVQAKL